MSQQESVVEKKQTYKRGRGTRTLDKDLGMRIRERRIVLGMSQSDLAERIGITYQQIYKYEHAVNRISVIILFEIAAVLKISVIDLIKDLSIETPQQQVVDDYNHSRLTIAKRLLQIKNLRYLQVLEFITATME